jgi:hypothetical protein
LVGSLIVVAGVLSWATVGSGRARNCPRGWFGYTPLTGKVIAVGHCTPDAGGDPQVSDRSLDFLRQTVRQAEEASHRRPSDVVATDEAAPMRDSDFDDALWLALSGRISSAAELAHYPPGVRMYFATRMVEWEIGNGGFSQVFENGVDEFFPDAKAGYLLLGDVASAQLLDRAAAAAGDEAALDALDASLDGPPWNGLPWSDGKRISYARTHRDEFKIN